MKKSGGCLKVYLALMLLIVLVAVFRYKEGFSNWSFFDVSSWFSSKEDEKKEKKVEPKEKKIEPNEKYDDKYGSGLLGTSYTTTQTTNDASYNDYYKKLDEPQFNK